MHILCTYTYVCAYMYVHNTWVIPGETNLELKVELLDFNEVWFVSLVKKIFSDRKNIQQRVWTVDAGGFSIEVNSHSHID